MGFEFSDLRCQFVCRCSLLAWGAILLGLTMNRVIGTDGQRSGCPHHRKFIKIMPAVSAAGLVGFNVGHRYGHY